MEDANGFLTKYKSTLDPFQWFISFSFGVVKVLRWTSVAVMKATAEKLPPNHRMRVLAMVNKISTDTNTLIDLKSANGRQEKLRTACMSIKFGIEELKSGCEEWDSQWRICEEPVSTSVKKESAPTWDMLRSCKYYKQAIHHFQVAELKAMEVLNDADGSSLAPLARIEALDILLFCQVLLHWNDKKQWFRMWRGIFETFVADRGLLKKAMGKASVFQQIFSENASVRNRMIKLVQVYAEVIISVIIDEPALTSDAQVFIQFFNDSLKDIKVHKDWRPLLGPEEARFGEHFWFKGNWGMIDFTPLTGGEKFVRVSGVKQLTWGPPTYLYGVADPHNTLIAIDSSTPTTRHEINERKVTLLGYADDQGRLYIGQGDVIRALQVNANPIEPQAPRKLPIYNSHIEDYTFQVASNGAILSYHKLKQIRHLSVDSVDWIEVVDPKHKKIRATVNPGDVLIVVGPDKDHSLLRLSVRTKKEIAKLQVERLQISKGCDFKKFALEAQLHDGSLTTDVTRIPNKGSIEATVFLLGYKEPRSKANDWSKKAQIAKLKVKINDGMVKSIKTVYQNDIFDVSSLDRAVLGKGTIFCDGGSN